PPLGRDTTSNGPRNKQRSTRNRNERSASKAGLSNIELYKQRWKGTALRRERRVLCRSGFYKNVRPAIYNGRPSGCFKRNRLYNSDRTDGKKIFRRREWIGQDYNRK